jgi:hypothetical protein
VVQLLDDNSLEMIQAEHLALYDRARQTLADNLGICVEAG